MVVGNESRGWVVAENVIIHCAVRRGCLAGTNLFEPAAAVIWAWALHREMQNSNEVHVPVILGWLPQPF